MLDRLVVSIEALLDFFRGLGPLVVPQCSNLDLHSWRGDGLLSPEPSRIGSRRTERLVHIHVIGEGEERAAVETIDPVQHSPVDALGRLPSGNVSSHEHRKDMVGKPTPQYRPGNRIAVFDEVVLVVDEASIQAGTSATPEKVGRETAGRVTLGTKRLR